MWTFKLKSQPFPHPSYWYAWCIRSSYQHAIKYASIYVNIHTQMNHGGDMLEISRNRVFVLQPAAAIGCGGEEKPDVFLFNKGLVYFFHLRRSPDLSRLPPPLRHRHAEEQPPNETDPLTNKERSPTEHPCGEKVTEHDEPAHADCIIHRVGVRSSHFYLWSKFMTLPTCFAPCQAALLSPKRCVALHPL